MRQAVIGPACLLGAPCENATAPGYLATHTISDDDYVDESLALSSSGHYCSYSGIRGSLSSEEKEWGFETPEPPRGDQVGDGHGDMCASWAAPEALRGLRLQNKEPKCFGAYDTCGIQRYWSFGGQGLANYPWANYFGNPSLHVTGYTEPLIFQAEEGGAWGYLCPVLEEEKGNILELCTEQWRMAPHKTEKWRNERVVECRTPSSHFPHSVDKIALRSEGAEEFWNGSHEPVEILGPHFDTGGSLALSGAALQAVVELDNRPYKHSSKEKARLTEPEAEYGFGIGASTTPAQWALIGGSNGLEGWRAGEAKVKL